MSKQAITVGVILAGMTLAGCSATGAGPTPPPTADCGAAALQDRIGEPVTGETAADVRVGGEPVQSLGNVRVVAPGEVVTMEFSAERLTLETDEAGNMAAARCG